jgi:hypothetical protein
MSAGCPCSRCPSRRAWSCPGQSWCLDAAFFQVAGTTWAGQNSKNSPLLLSILWVYLQDLFTQNLRFSFSAFDFKYNNGLIRLLHKLPAFVVSRTLHTDTVPCPNIHLRCFVKGLYTQCIQGVVVSHCLRLGSILLPGWWGGEGRGIWALGSLLTYLPACYTGCVLPPPPLPSPVLEFLNNL